MPVVICNAGPLMALGKLNRLDLLNGLFEEVSITQAVYDEVVIQGVVRGLPDAFTVRMFWQRQQWPIVNVPKELLSAYAPPVVLGLGEIEVLSLAQSHAATLVLLDDEVARAEARRLRLQVCGTLGILVRSYRQELLALDQTELLIREIATRPDIWIAARLCEQVMASLHKPDQ